MELKSGEIVRGHLTNCDSWMNLTLSDVVQISVDKNRFVKLPECYVRGNYIKYLRLPEEVRKTMLAKRFKTKC